MKSNKTTLIQCPSCGTKHEVNPGKLLALFADEDKREKSMAKAREARWKGHKKRDKIRVK